MPVKLQRTGGFRLEARSGANGALLWTAPTDYVLPAHDWTPSYNVAITSGNRVYFPGAGGKVYFRDNVDSADGGVDYAVFFGRDAYDAARAAYDEGSGRHVADPPAGVDARLRRSKVQRRAAVEVARARPPNGDDPRRNRGDAIARAHAPGHGVLPSLLLCHLRLPPRRQGALRHSGHLGSPRRRRGGFTPSGNQRPQSHDAENQQQQRDTDGRLHLW